MPGSEIDDRRCDEERSLVQQQNVGADQDGERDHQHAEGHPAPQPAAGDRIVGGAEMELAENQVRRAQLTIAEPEEHERGHGEERTGSRRDNPEVCALGNEPARRRGPRCIRAGGLRGGARACHDLPPTRRRPPYHASASARYHASALCTVMFLQCHLGRERGDERAGGKATEEVHNPHA